MSVARVFAYARVSTHDQTTENQAREIAAAGFDIEPKRLVVETVSGSTAAKQRKEFVRLIDRLEAADVLVVTKLDRLGRDAIDIVSTVNVLEAAGVRVHCLALGGMDLTSAAGKMTMGVLASVAQFERDLLIERTQSGLARVRAEGKTLGRRPKLAADQQQAVREGLKAGASLGALAKAHNVSRAAIQRVKARTD